MMYRKYDEDVINRSKKEKLLKLKKMIREAKQYGWAGFIMRPSDMIEEFYWEDEGVCEDVVKIEEYYLSVEQLEWLLNHQENPRYNEIDVYSWYGAIIETSCKGSAIGDEAIGGESNTGGISEMGYISITIDDILKIDIPDKITIITFLGDKIPYKDK